MTVALPIQLLGTTEMSEVNCNTRYRVNFAGDCLGSAADSVKLLRLGTVSLTEAKL